MPKHTYLLLIFLLPVLSACHSSDKKNKNANLSKDGSAAFHGFHFFVLGDWGRRGKASQVAVAKQLIAYAKKRHPAFIITTGDNFYQEGVRSIHDSHWKQSFTDVYKDLTRDYDWYPTLGNHDYQGSANPKAQIEYHQVNPRWHMPYYYYTIVAATPDSQHVRFVMIDTNPFYKDYYRTGECPLIKTQDTARQRRWIDSTLANSKEEWKFVVGHHPVFSAGSDHGITPEMMSMLKPMLEKYNVQAYICGHDHTMQHLQRPHSAVDYFVSGGGGDVIPLGSYPPMKFGRSTSGFADIAINGDSLTLQFIDQEGRIIYNYARKR